MKTLLELVRERVGFSFYKHRDEDETSDQIEDKITAEIERMSPLDLLTTISDVLEEEREATAHGDRG